MLKDRLDAYTQEVLKFRKALNLTSVSQAKLFDERFIVPSVDLSQWMPNEGRLLDIGSGMGVPGIPLLITKPKLHGVLVERRKKRAEFLRHVRRKLNLHMDVYDADINDLPCLAIDICVARAVTRVEELLAMCTRHVNVDAIAVLPVPREQAVAIVPGWKIEAVHDVNAVESQKIQCYRWEGVSRET